MKASTTLKVLALCVSTAAHGKTLTIGIDLSGSNPLLQHKNFAEAAGLYAATQVSQLKEGDILRLQSFGARSAAENIASFTTKVSRRNRANKLASQIAGIIRTLPDRTKNGQVSTNIIAWLEFNHDFDCKSGSTILAITDGLESSSYIGINDLISGKKPLPEPDVDLKQCELTFYGLGSGMEPNYVKNIRNAWSSYAEKAGASFSAIIP